VVNGARLYHISSTEMLYIQ